MPVTVDTDVASDATAHMPQGSSFKAVGLIWLFYSDGTNLCYRTSPDGLTWSGKTTIRTCSLGCKFSVRHAEYLGVDYVYYAFSGGVTGYPLIFRRGVLNADGTITWEPEVTVAVASIILHYAFPDIEIGTDGRLFISACRGTAYRHSVAVWSNPNNDGSGTWAFDVVLSAVDMDVHAINGLTRLTAGKIYCAGQKPNPLYGNLWDGTVWVGEETIDPAGTLSRYFGLASLNDTVIVGFEETAIGDENLYSRRRNGVWSDRELVSSTDPNPNTLSVDPLTGETYVFWVEKHGYLVNIYMCKRNGVWGATLILASDEVYPKILTCSSWREMVDNQIGVAWVTREIAPFHLRYEVYTPVVPVIRILGEGFVCIVHGI